MADTEQVLGSELRAGDVILERGHRLVVKEITYDGGRLMGGVDGDLGYYGVETVALDPPIISIRPQAMSIARREDLPFTRET